MRPGYSGFKGQSCRALSILAESENNISNIFVHRVTRMQIVAVVHINVRRFGVCPLRRKC